MSDMYVNRIGKLYDRYIGKGTSIVHCPFSSVTHYRYIVQGKIPHLRVPNITYQAFRCKVEISLAFANSQEKDLGKWCYEVESR